MSFFYKTQKLVLGQTHHLIAQGLVLFRRADNTSQGLFSAFLDPGSTPGAPGTYPGTPRKRTPGHPGNALEHAILEQLQAKMGDSLQVGPPQGEEEVSEKDIEALFVIDEDEIETLSGKDKAPFEVTKQKRDVEEQRGNTGDGEGADSKESPEATTPTEEERLRHSRIEQQLALEGAGFGSMSTPQQRRSLTSDMMTETNNMILATSKVVMKMDKLEEKLDQQVAMLKRQSESFRVHYLEGQKAAARQASEASRQHQLLSTQVDSNKEQNGKIAFLLREVKEGLRSSLERTEGGMKSCFEFAASTDIDHKKRLEECQNRYHQRHVELREELCSLQAMVYSLAAHVQGSQPLEPAVGDPTQIPVQSQEPADEVLPNTEKRMLLQRSFSELCKFSYKSKVSKHDWCPRRVQAW